MKKLGFIIACVFLLAGCRTSQEEYINKLDSHVQKWVDANIDHYEITVHTVSVWWDETYVIEVKDDEVASYSVSCEQALIPMKDCEINMSDIDPDDYTVNGLFNEIRKNISYNDSDYWDLRYYQITYSPLYGYPIQISYDHPDVLDEEVTINISLRFLGE